MSVTVADIQAMPGLSAMADADVQFWIDESTAWVGSVFGTTGSTTHDRATRYWVAHALTVQTGIGMGSSGPVNSRKVGDVSVGYGPSGGGRRGGGGRTNTEAAAARLRAAAAEEETESATLQSIIIVIYLFSIYLFSVKPFSNKLFSNYKLIFLQMT